MIHLILQPQAKVGKKYVAFMLNEYLSRAVEDFTFYHADRVAHGDWDNLFEKYFNSENVVFLIVVDSLIFSEFDSYLNESKISDIIKKSGGEIIRHFLFNLGERGEGGELLIDYITRSLSEDFKSIIWQNEGVGLSLKEFSNGQYDKLSQMPEFKELKNLIWSFPYLPSLCFLDKKALFDLFRSDMLFDQIIYDSSADLLLRQRLFKIKSKALKVVDNAVA